VGNTTEKPNSSRPIIPQSPLQLAVSTVHSAVLKKVYDPGFVDARDVFIFL
jgi:hypothetical protein